MAARSAAVPSSDLQPTPCLRPLWHRDRCRSAPLTNEFPLVVATMPANARQRRIALGGIVIMAVVVAITLPFANIERTRVDAFAPVIQTIMCVADLLTATFLFAQYAVQSQRALLALASGYVFSGLFAFPIVAGDLLSTV